jgi:hypothetical protein
MLFLQSITARSVPLASECHTWVCVYIQHFPQPRIYYACTHDSQTFGKQCMRELIAGVVEQQQQ